MKLIPVFDTSNITVGDTLLIETRDSGLDGLQLRRITEIHADLILLDDKDLDRRIIFLKDYQTGSEKCWVLIASKVMSLKEILARIPHSKEIGSTVCDCYKKMGGPHTKTCKCEKCGNLIAGRPRP